MTFNSFPQPRPDAVGGSPNLLNWSAYQPVYDLTGTTVSVPISSWYTFVDISGKGYFKWCRVDTSTFSAANPSIQLTVDGIPYIFETANGGDIIQGNEVNYEIPFKTSLKIEGHNRTASAANLSCDYLYFLQRSTPSKDITLLTQSQRKMVYFTGNSLTLVDAINVTGSGYFLGMRLLGYNTSGGMYGDITVDGVNKMSDRRLFKHGSADGKQPEVVGPIRFNSGLRIKTRSDGSTAYYSLFAWYTLD